MKQFNIYGNNLFVFGFYKTANFDSETPIFSTILDMAGY